MTEKKPLYTPIPIKRNCGDTEGSTHWMGCDCHEERHQKEKDFLKSQLEKALREKEALLKAYYNLHMDTCEGCGAKEDSIKDELKLEAAKILGEGK